jgi:hypothetical protein
MGYIYPPKDIISPTEKIRIIIIIKDKNKG